MIKFRCRNCQQKIGVPEEHAGKRGKCPACQAVVIVPQLQTELKPEEGFACFSSAINEESFPVLSTPGQSSQKQQCYNEKKPSAEGSVPKWVWHFAIVAIVCFLSFLFYMFVLRDTWETDNWERIIGYQKDASILIAKGEIRKGINTYDELFALVGTRTLKKSRLQQVYRDAQGEYETILERRKTIHVPLMAKRDKVVDLLESLKIHESIALCDQLLAKDDDASKQSDPFTAKILVDIKQLKIRSEVKLKELIAQEENTILPNIVDLYNKAVSCFDQAQFQQSVDYLKRIIASEKNMTWSPKVAEAIGIAKASLEKAQEMLDEQQRLAREAEDRRREAERVKNQRRRERERKQAEIEANTRILICSHCGGSGRPTYQDIKEWEYTVSAISAANTGFGGFSTGPRKPTLCPKCRGTGTIKTVYNSYAR